MEKIFFFYFIITSISYPQSKILTEYVNPFIGTNNMGHTYPGAVVPFGMLQLSPETDTIMYSYGNGYGYNQEVYRYCSGYQYDDQTIVGFSHTHFSGTGHSDLGDFLIMPTVGELKLNPGTKENPETGYRSRFSHKNEKASPGYYSVKLDDYNIDVELTATERVGFHKYKFPETSDAHFILDLTSGIYNYDDKVTWSFIRVENDTLVTGYRQTNGWARTRYIYFAMTLSKPIKSYGIRNNEELTYKGFWRKWNQDENFPERAGKNLVCYFNFKMEHDEELMIKFALSGVSTEGAVQNLQTEIPHWNFEAVKIEANEKWNKELSKIIIEADEEKKINFYTALYHSMLSPIIFQDVDGNYRRLDQNIHKAEGFVNYTIFSLWDTYRALHPLFTIIQQERTNDIINSMLAHYEQSVHKILPVWSHWTNENWCMIGYHSVPVIVDAYMKGIRNYDVNTAFEAALSSANYDPYDGIGYYKKYGYVPEDLNTNSASKTLEYAYDDWTIYKFAEALDEDKAAGDFKKRAFNYKNIFDHQTKYMRAKNSVGNWKEPFDPLSTLGQGYIEGNAWNYSLYVPQDINGFIKLIGGKEKLISWIDSLFSMEIPEKYFTESEDVTRIGAIGNYIHGNEPSHHIPYLYCYAGEPWKTQERIHEIMKEMYKNTTDGLCGNDDCGQMSAWYIFSALGFYPVTPGSNEYIIGSPFIKEATINLENGNKFKIIAQNYSGKNIYIENISLNNEKINRCFITHNEIIEGGELKFLMTDKPNKKLFDDSIIMPYSMTK
jgi:predicted alpha-1,2-mannosidase